MEELLSNTGMWAGLASILVALFNFLKVINERKKNDAWKGIVNESLASQAQEFGDLKAQFLSDRAADCFRKNFRNAINEKVAIMISNSDVLIDNCELVNSLTEFGKEFAEFGLRFFYSSYRKSKEYEEEDFYQYLKMDIDLILSNLNSSIQQGIKAEKAYMHSNKVVYIDFVNYLKEINKDFQDPDMEKIKDQLLIKLMANGFDEDKFMTVMLTYMGRYIRFVRNKYKEFLKLADYDKELEKMLQ